MLLTYETQNTRPYTLGYHLLRYSIYHISSNNSQGQLFFLFAPKWGNYSSKGIIQAGQLFQLLVGTCKCSVDTIKLQKLN